MMKAKTNVLFVFEGQRREPMYFESLFTHFMDSSLTAVKYILGNDIYELYKKIDEDPDLSLYELLKESNKLDINNDIFEKYKADYFSQIFLFFDMEFHDDLFSPEKITKMVNTFDEETEQGKLFISYPMVEAIRDIPSFEGFVQYSISIANAKSSVYKAASSQKLQNFVDPTRIQREDWLRLITSSAKKANFIVNGDISRTDYVEQSDILAKQIEFIDAQQMIYVLSAFPLFIQHQKGSAVLG